MATNESAKNELSAASQKSNSILSLMHGMKSSMTDLLPKYMTPERMARIVLINTKLNPKLLNCTDTSLAGAVMQSVQLGIEPILGNAHLIPYGNQCVFQLGYPGIIDLFYRHENSGLLDCNIAYENDEFDFEFGTSSFIKHKPAKKNRGNATHFYCVVELKSGFKKFGVMSTEEIESHARKYSQAYRQGKKDSPWFTAFNSMALKTVIIQTLKFSPKSAVLQQAFEADNSIRNFDPENNIFDVPPTYETPEDNPEKKPVVKSKEKIEPAEVVEPNEKEIDKELEKLDSAINDNTNELSTDEKFEIKCEDKGITGNVLLKYFNEVREIPVSDAVDIYSGDEFMEFRKSFVDTSANLNALIDIKKSMK